MTKAKKSNKYDTIQYTPPTPQVFGNSTPTDLPTYPTPKPSSFEVGPVLPPQRLKLADRLAVYEDDNPRWQKALCWFGFLFPPLWVVGAVMYMQTPSTKVLTREAGFKNCVLMVGALSFVALYFIYEYFLEDYFVGDAAAKHADPAPRLRRLL